MKKWILSRLFSGLVILGLFWTMAVYSENDTTALWGQSVCGSVDVLLSPTTAAYSDILEVSINISNNQCVMSPFGFDLIYDTSMFTFQGINRQNCLTSDWSMLSGNEISPGQVRIGGCPGTGTEILATQNGTLVKVNLLVIGQGGSHVDGQQSVVSVNSYLDDLVNYTPQPSSGTFTLIVSGGVASLPTNLSGNWGDLVHIPVHIANNSTQVSDFAFDFVFDPQVMKIQDIERTAVIQDWTTLNWTQVETGRIRITGQAGSGTYLPSSSDTDLVNVKVMVACVGYGVNTSVPFRIEAYQNDIATLCPRVFASIFMYYPCPRLGDVNGDGTVTAGDAQAAFEIFLGLCIPTLSQLTTADANCGCPCGGLEHRTVNNCITPTDAQWIFEHFLVLRQLPQCSADYTCPGSLAAPVSLLAQGPPYAKKIFIYPLSITGMAGEQVMIPIMVSNAEGISKFGFDMIFPRDSLDYIGVLASPLTQGFEEIKGEEEFPGILRVKGTNPTGVKARVKGSLCVAVFQVKDDAWGTASLELINLNEDLYTAQPQSGIFRAKYGITDKGSIYLGKGRENGGKLAVSVGVADVSEVKAFLGVERTRLSRDYISVEGNVIADGIIRVGGYGNTGLQDNTSGEFIRLVFKVKEPGAKIELLKAEDDLKDSVLLK